MPAIGDLVRIRGLNKADNGRKCGEHRVCGESVQAGDIFIVQRGTVSFRGMVLIIFTDDVSSNFSLCFIN